ncbi:RluA family pseudouridine synthase [Bacillus cereus]
MKVKKTGEWCEITVPSEWAGRTIDSILKEEWQVPKKLLHKYRMEKSILVNGEGKRWSEQLQKEDKLQVHMFIQEEYDVEPEFYDIEVIYEDDHVLIVNKPIQVDTHPANKGGTGTLANYVAFHLQMQGIETKVRHIHRLDKDTTGGVVFAKHALAGVIMDRLLTERKIKRTYMALVEGKVQKKRGTIDAPIGRDRHHASRRRVSPKGDRAVTHYEVVQYAKESNITLVKVQLETGRTHQIRVHMSYLGHPLIGDVLYGCKTRLLSRQALHAAHITMLHPITKQQMEADIPLPHDFSRLLQSCMNTK